MTAPLPPLPARLRESLSAWTRLAELETSLALRGVRTPVLAPGDLQGHCLRILVHTLSLLTRHGRHVPAPGGDPDIEGGE